MKRNIYISIITFITVFTISSCEFLEQLAGENLDELTTEQVIQGLKTALEIGTDSSATTLSARDGYYKNSLLKIPLPDEAQQVRMQVVALVNKFPELAEYFDLDEKFENVVESINRAAEEAAKDAKPIFVDAITGITIDQGWDILNGVNPLSQMKSDGFDSTAATGYFKEVTFSPLQGLFAPKIDAQLNKDLGLGFSANQAWSALRNAINTALNSIEGNFVLNTLYQSSGYTVNRISQESIGDFATEKALTGLFYKVGEEEKKIRKNPYIWAEDIIQKVFGSVYVK